MCSQVLSCPLCCKPNFESVDQLKISLVKVSNQALFCPLCNEMVFGLDKLTIHLFGHSLAMDVVEKEPRSDSVKIQPETPQSPSVTSNSVAVLTPIKTPPSSSSSSSGCPTSSSTSTPAAPSNISEVKCEICDFVLDNEKHLSMHRNLVHVVEPAAVAEVDNIVTNESKLFPCHLCNKSFKMKGRLRVHLMVVHMHGFQHIAGAKETENKNTDDGQLGGQLVGGGGGELGIIGGIKCASLEQQLKPESSSSTKDDLQPVNSPDQSKSWICDICTKSFTTKYFLKKHKRLHTGEMPYACTICGKTFTFQQSYHKHLSYHSDEKPHVCGTCGRAFKELSTLHNHERIHSGEKPFKCETCGKCFRQRVSYLVHRRIHDGTMPYKCTACAKSFRYKVSQKTHKCPAQPPGQVVRQSGELLNKLMQNSNLLNEETQYQIDSEERHRINAMIDKSIEDMANGKVEHINELFPTPMVEEILGISTGSRDDQGLMNSPSDKFQNLCIYSPLSNDSIEELFYTNQMGN